MANRYKEDPLYMAMEHAHSAGLVSKRTKGSLAIYNYTPEVAISRNWTEVTKMARGLIIDESTGRVVARPFGKFFNVGETEETRPENWPDEPFNLYDKLDGSLGILFFHGGAWDIATRGSFESEQANYAREYLLPKYLPPDWTPAITVLVEIIYPDNRVVVDYEGVSELRLLAITERLTGRSMSHDMVVKWGILSGMRVAEQVGTGLKDLREIPPHRPNTEGYVLHFPCSDVRMKIKSEDYVAAHACLDQVRPRRVLQHIKEGRTDDVRRLLPPLLRRDYDDLERDLLQEFRKIRSSGHRLYQAHQHLLPDRKAFAYAIRDASKPDKALAFLFADKRDVWDKTWRFVDDSLPRQRPHGEPNNDESTT